MVTNDQAYLLWSYLKDNNWDGLEQVLENQTVWNELGNDEAEQLQKVILELKQEEATFPENFKDLATLLNSWIG